MTFKTFNKKCPVCQMDLKQGNDYPQGFGKEFCSEVCRREYAGRLREGTAKKKSGCCCS